MVLCYRNVFLYGKNKPQTGNSILYMNLLNQFEAVLHGYIYMHGNTYCNLQITNTSETWFLHEWTLGKLGWAFYIYRKNYRNWDEYQQHLATIRIWTLDVYIYALHRSDWPGWFLHGEAFPGSRAEKWRAAAGQARWSWLLWRTCACTGTAWTPYT